MLVLSLTAIVHDVVRLDILAVADLADQALALGFGLVLAAFLAWHLGQDYAAPLALIKNKVTQMTGGDLDAPLSGLQRADEIGQLAKAVELWRHHALTCKNEHEHLNDASRQLQEKLNLTESLMVELEGLVHTSILTAFEAARTLDAGCLAVTSLADLSKSRASAISADSCQISKQVLETSIASEELAQSLKNTLLQFAALQAKAAKAAAGIKQARDGAAKIGRAALPLEQGHQQPAQQMALIQGLVQQEEQALKDCDALFSRMEGLTQGLAKGMERQSDAAQGILKNSLQASKEVEVIFQAANETLNLSQLAANISQNLSLGATQLTARADKIRADLNRLMYKIGEASAEEQDAYFLWHEGLLCGLEIVDQDHRILAAYLNDLHLAMHKGLGEETVERILDGLAAFTKAHFKREKHHLAAMPPEKREQHLKAQEIFSAKVESLQISLQKKNGIHAAQGLSFLKEWLSLHIEDSVSHLTCALPDYRAQPQGE